MGVRAPADGWAAALCPGQHKGLHAPEERAPHPRGGVWLGQNPEEGPRAGCGEALGPEQGARRDPLPGAEQASALRGEVLPRAGEGGTWLLHPADLPGPCWPSATAAHLSSNLQHCGPWRGLESG